jgi:hypothetical protein
MGDQKHYNWFVSVIGTFEFRICFGFRASNFEFSGQTERF